MFQNKFFTCNITYAYLCADPYPPKLRIKRGGLRLNKVLYQYFLLYTLIFYFRTRGLKLEIFFHITSEIYIVGDLQKLLGRTGCREKCLILYLSRTDLSLV